MDGCQINTRVALRLWREEDALALFRLASDPDVGSRAGWAPHKSVEESRHIIQTVFCNDTTWAIVLPEDNRIVGAIGYGPSCDCHLPALPDEPTVGYWIGKPYWNRDLCTAALRAMIEQIRRKNESAPAEEQIKSLISGHFVDNPASGRVMEKCGFVPTGDICYDNTLYAGTERPMRVLRLRLS